MSEGINARVLLRMCFYPCGSMKAHAILSAHAPTRIRSGARTRFEEGARAYAHQSTYAYA